MCLSTLLVRSTADELALIYVPFVDDDLVIHVLNGVSQEFKELSSELNLTNQPYPLKSWLRRNY